MANGSSLDGLPRHLSAPSSLSLKAREQHSRALKRIFDQINSASSDRHRFGSSDALDRTSDGTRRLPAKDAFVSTLGSSADVDLRLAAGMPRETRNFLCDSGSLGAGVGEARDSDGRRLGYGQEASLASSQNNRYTFLEASRVSRIDGIDKKRPAEQEPTIDPSKKRAILNNLHASSMQVSNQRRVRSSSPALSFQTQQSDGSDHSLGSGFLRHVQENMQASTSLAGHKLSTTPSYVATTCRQPTAQLTIFYSGMVHVYDDVPADKAHAIMLLAGDGNSSNSHFVNASSNTGFPTAVTGTSATRELSVNRISAGVSKTAVASSAFSAKMKHRLVQHSDAELPFARKASLARFLVKRKDRIQAKPIVNAEEKAVEKDDEASDQSRSPKKLCSRPASPSPPPSP